MDSIYRDKIIMSYKLLLNLHEKLMERIINVAMTGEYEDINKMFQEGDSFQFNIEQFKDTKDVNLNKLVAFYEQLEELMNSLANINKLTEEEVVFNDEDAEDDYLDL